MGQEKSFESKENAIRYLEKLRCRSLFLLVLYIILSSIFGAAGFGLVVASAIAFEGTALALGLTGGFVGFLVLLPVFLILLFRLTPEYEKALYAYLSPWLLEKGPYSKAFYVKKKQVEPLVFEISRQINRSLDLEDNPAFRGDIKGVSFLTFGYRSYFSVGRRNNKTENYSGRVISFDLPTNVKTDVFIKQKVALPIFKKVRLRHIIHTESILFDRQYDVLVQDERLSRILVNPVLIDGILSLGKEYGGFVNVYFKKDKVLVFYDKYFSAFHPGLTHRIDDAFLEGFLAELRLPYRVFRSLDLGNFTLALE